MTSSHNCSPPIQQYSVPTVYTLTFVSLLGYTGLSVGVHALPTDSLPGHSHPRAKDLLLPAPRIRLEDDTHSNEFAGNIFYTQGIIYSMSKK